MCFLLRIDLSLLVCIHADYRVSVCCVVCVFFFVFLFFFFFVYFVFFQAEDGIRDLVRSRGLGDVYKRQDLHPEEPLRLVHEVWAAAERLPHRFGHVVADGESAKCDKHCLLYTSDAADERSSVDLGGRRIIKKKKKDKQKKKHKNNKKKKKTRKRHENNKV